VGHALPPTVFEIDQQKLPVVLYFSQNIAFLTIIMRQDDGRVSWHKFREILLIALEKEHAVEVIYRFQGLRMWHPIILQETSAPRGQLLLDFDSPRVDGHVDVETALIYRFDLLNGFSEHGVEVIFENSVTELLHQAGIAHLPYRNRPAFKEALESVVFVLEQKLGSYFLI
jgi:hypothetical protein